jgi:hypothetical protein
MEANIRRNKFFMSLALEFEVVGYGREDWKKINQARFLRAAISYDLTVVIFGYTRVNGERILAVIGVVHREDP